MTKISASSKSKSKSKSKSSSSTSVRRLRIIVIVAICLALSLWNIKDPIKTYYLDPGIQSWKEEKVNQILKNQTQELLKEEKDNQIQKNQTQEPLVGEKNNDQIQTNQTQGEQKNQIQKKPFDEPNEKPLAVIHVGPHKTGSTTLQDFMIGNSKRRMKLRNEDNYFVFYDQHNEHRNKKKNHASLAVCLNRDLKWRKLLKQWCRNKFYEARVKQDFSDYVQMVIKRNGNILFSSEELDREGADIGWFKDLLEPHFEVRIILFYRRFYEWIGSYVNQLGKTYITELRKTAGGERVSPIGRWLEENLDDLSKQHTYNVWERYGRYFGGRNAITVLDFHDTETPLEESFVCTVFPRESWACTNVTSPDNGMEKIIRNYRRDIDFMRIHEGIADRFGPTLEGQEKRKLEKIWDRMKENNEHTMWNEGDPYPEHEDDGDEEDLSIPRICPTRALVDKILDMSRRYEKGLEDVLPESAKRYLPMEEDFRKQLERSFCTLDVDRILDRWETKRWFQNMLSGTADGGTGTTNRK